MKCLTGIHCNHVDIWALMTMKLCPIWFSEFSAPLACKCQNLEKYRITKPADYFWVTFDSFWGSLVSNKVDLSLIPKHHKFVQIPGTLCSWSQKLLRLLVLWNILLNIFSEMKKSNSKEKKETVVILFFKNCLT